MKIVPDYEIVDGVLLWLMRYYDECHPASKGMDVFLSVFSESDAEYLLSRAPVLNKIRLITQKITLVTEPVKTEFINMILR